MEFENLLYSPNLKMVLIFLVTKVFQKGTMFKWVCFTLTWDATSRNGQRGYVVAWVCTDPQKKSPLGSPVKIASRWFLVLFTVPYFFIRWSGSIERFLVPAAILVFICTEGAGVRVYIEWGDGDEKSSLTLTLYFSVFLPNCPPPPE